jgi:hypothetical protein
MCLFHRTDLVTLVIQIQNAVALICEPAVALFALWGCGQFKPLPSKQKVWKHNAASFACAQKHD